MWPGTEGTALDVVATSPGVDVEEVDITSLEVAEEVEAEAEEVEGAMEGLEGLEGTLVGVVVSLGRAKEGITAATGEATLSEGSGEEQEGCPLVTGWDREEAMLLLSEVEVGGKIKVSSVTSLIIFST